MNVKPNTIEVSPTQRIALGLELTNELKPASRDEIKAWIDSQILPMLDAKAAKVKEFVGGYSVPTVPTNVNTEQGTEQR